MFKKLKNRYLVWRFPYLRPRRYDGSIIKEYNYDYTDLDCFPDGWRDVIIKYCKRLNVVLKKYKQLDNFFITDAKEKWGSARIYYSGVSSNECREIIDKLLWQMESETWHTCNGCGKKATYSSIGYVLPFCDKCMKQHKVYGINNAFEKIEND